MRLKQLKISNFKGIKEFTLDIDGKNASVYGRNGIGKTTLQDAFLWLVFGKDSNQKTPEGTGFELKPRVKGIVAEGLICTVEGFLEHEGKPLHLKRVFFEKWTKPKGQVEKVFSGHTTEFYIDDVPYADKEYSAYISKIIEEKKFRNITDPMFFNSMDWKERRAIMMATCSEVSDLDVLNANSKLAAIRDIIIDKGPDDALKMFKAQRKKLSDDIEAIPSRIDEVNRALPVIADGVDMNELRAKKAMLEDSLASTRDSIDALKEVAYDKRSQLQAQISETKEKIREIEEQNKAASRSVVDARIELKRLDERFEESKAAIVDIEEKITRLIEERDEQNAIVKKAGADWRETKATTSEGIDVSLSCPLCGQIFPEDQAKQKEAEAKANFDAEIQKALDKIVITGNTAKTSAEKLTLRIEALEKYKVTTKETLEACIEKRRPLELASNAVVEQISTESLDEKLVNLQALVAKPIEYDSTRLDEVLAETQAEINELAKIIANEDAFINAKARIKELLEDEKVKGTEIVALDGKILAVEQFIQLKAEMQEEDLNGRFQNVTFRLFNRLQTGAIEPTFETLVGEDKIKFASANTAGQINAGLEIIEHLTKHYGFNAPVFVDHVESVTDIHPINSQMIKLIVSKDHKKLKVEVE